MTLTSSRRCFSNLLIWFTALLLSRETRLTQVSLCNPVFPSCSATAVDCMHIERKL